MFTVVMGSLTYLFPFLTVTVLLGSSNETSFRKTLPVGNVKKNYNATIEVRVQSCVGETTYVDIPVTVSKHYGSNRVRYPSVNNTLSVLIWNNIILMKYHIRYSKREYPGS